MGGRQASAGNGRGGGHRLPCHGWRWHAVRCSTPLAACTSQPRGQARACAGGGEAAEPCPEAPRLLSTSSGTQSHRSSMVWIRML